MRVCLLLLVAAALTHAGCGGGSPSYVDGGTGRLLVILDPPGSQLGLRFGQSTQLRVQYVLDDSGREVLRGEPVQFAFVKIETNDDPGTSTLAHDTATTDSNGIATVTLTAGSQEGLSFAVAASAPGAPTVDFDVSVSASAFVSIAAVVTDPLPQPGARTLTAGLYSARTCAELGPSPTLTGATRTLGGSGGATATLAFENLLSRDYAVVGRVEDGGELVAYGCVDVAAEQASPGATLSVPVPLSGISPSVVGTYAVTTTLDGARNARTDARFAPIDVIDRCPGHASQLLLDALGPLLPPARAALIETARGATTASTSGTSTVSCRGTGMLDTMIDALLAATPDGTLRTALVSDLDSILATGMLRSSLALVASTPHADDTLATQRYVATHSAGTVTLTLGSSTTATMIDATPLPLVVATGIDASVTSDMLTIGAHELTLGLPALWGAAFDKDSLAVRIPALPTDTWSAWLGATVTAATSGGKTGCAAIEAVICAQTGASGCAGTITGPCATAVTAAGGQLDAVFTGGDALTLAGTCTIIDSDHDLVADSLTAGSFTTTGATDPMLPFTATKGM